MVSPAEWESQLGNALAKNVTVRYGRARTQPVRATFDNGSVDIRLHEFFRTAPPEIAGDLAAWLRAGRRARGACARLDEWIDAQLFALPKREQKRATISGRVHDLDPMARALFEQEFASDFDSHVRPEWTWGRRVRSRARRSLQLGCYVKESHLVRIHTVLDQAAVPEWFVRFVLFHEILHAALPSERQPHGRVFRDRERAHPQYAAAVAWQKQHLESLIRSARSGKPMTKRRGVQGIFFPLR